MQHASFVNNFCYKFILRLFRSDKRSAFANSLVLSQSVFLDEIMSCLCIISQPSAHLLTCGTLFGNQNEFSAANTI